MSMNKKQKCVCQIVLETVVGGTDPGHIAVDDIAFHDIHNTCTLMPTDAIPKATTPASTTVATTPLSATARKYE